MKTLILILSLVGIAGCNQLKNPNKSFHFPLGSKWTFIKNDTKSEANYAEIEFNKDSTLLIQSEIDGWLGPFQYKELNNVLTFNNIAFSIIPDTNGFIILRNQSDEFLLYKIPFHNKDLTANEFDPFYLRRCFYLVQLNFITTDDALNYLSKIHVIPSDSLPEEQIISN